MVFGAPPALSARIPDLVRKQISRDFDIDVPVIIRTSDELREAARSNPFLRAGADLRVLHVGFLAGLPDRAAVAALDPDRSPPDRYVVRGRHVYFHLPHGMGRSKLTSQYFDSRLRTAITVRNWNTVLRLIELAGSG